MINIETDINLILKIYGVVLTFSTNSSELMKEIRKDFGSFEINIIPGKIDGSMRIIKIDRKFPLSIPKYAIRESFLPPASFIFNKSNLIFLEEKGKRIIKVDYEKNNILGYFKSPCDYSLFLRFLLKWMLIKSLEKKGIVFIHGSGVERDGQSLFFIGPSHFGKTYTLIIFLLNDYNLITDDTILFREDRVLPFSIRSNIHLNTFKQFPVLEKGLNDKSTRIPEIGWLIDLKSIFPFQENEVRPSKLFYINIWNASETKIEAIPNKEMLARLLHTYQIELDYTLYNLNKDKAMRNIFHDYNAFVDKANCYEVYAGSDESLFLRAIQAV
ncbi:MAG: hypothetical protein ACFFDN_19540 [Candidatus Hodarchaeota archaeon]